MLADGVVTGTVWADAVVAPNVVEGSVAVTGVVGKAVVVISEEIQTKKVGRNLSCLKLFT